MPSALQSLEIVLIKNSLLVAFAVMGSTVWIS
ncbi:malonate transporter subunit MadM, partial [bacterium]|nr:malonate transporter subunit MadM [bacterium]NBT63262.1 malonate transporter subunit MadM [Planctomycetia bacterium]